MRSEKNSEDGQRESFFAGKGFYIVLFLCAAVIGVSAWTLISRSRTSVEPEPIEDIVMSAVTPAAIEPVKTPAPVIWEVPDDAVEVVAQPSPPAVAATEASEPEPPAPEPVAQTAGFIWPVMGEVEKEYSVEALLYDRTMADWRTHDGLDIAAPLGEKVLSVSAGKVAKVYTDELYGSTVVTDHANGLQSVYSNLAATPAVSEGESVLTGQVIGAVGDTALCEIGEVYHLHLSMTQNGASIDPREYLPRL